MDTMVGRIRPGAAVDCRDGKLGTVEAIEGGTGEREELVRVTRGWSGRSVLVPADLIDRVDDDGTVHLACEKAAIDDLVDRGGYTDPLDERTERLDVELPERTMELREEELVAHKAMRDVGAAEIRKVVEEVPSRLEVDAQREEVIVEHRAVGDVVSEKVEPWTEADGTLVVPIYEEQLVLVKRLVMREQVRVRRAVTTERRLFEDTVRRERLVVEDPDRTGLVHERYPTDEPDTSETPQEASAKEGGLLEKVIWKALH